MRRLPSQAIVLAAGLGTRLRTIHRQPKFSLRIRGIPLIHYPLLSLKRVGVEKFIITVAEGYEDLLGQVVASVPGGIDFEVITNPHPEMGNGHSLLMARGHVSGIFFVSMCDHIYPPELPALIGNSYSRGLDVAMGGDSDARYVDVEEATKIQADDSGFVVKVGKGLRRHTHVDVGVFIMNDRIFTVAEEVAETGSLKLSDLINLAIKRGLKVRVVDVTGIPWTDVDTPSDVEELLRGSKVRVLEAFNKSIGSV